MRTVLVEPPPCPAPPPRVEVRDGNGDERARVWAVVERGGDGTLRASGPVIEMFDAHPFASWLLVETDLETAARVVRRTLAAKLFTLARDLYQPDPVTPDAEALVAVPAAFVAPAVPPVLADAA